MRVLRLRGGAPRSPLAFWQRALVAFAVAEAVLLVVLVVDQYQSSTLPGDRDRARAGGRFEQNELLDYRFRLPEGWDVHTSGTVTKVVSPTRDVGLAIGPAPRGDVLTSADTLADELSARYEVVGVDERGLITVAGTLGVELFGRAINSKDRALNFRLIAIEGEERNYTVTIFSSRPLRDSADATGVYRILSSLDLSGRH